MTSRIPNTVESVWFPLPVIWASEVTGLSKAAGECVWGDGVVIPCGAYVLHGKEIDGPQVRSKLIGECKSAWETCSTNSEVIVFMLWYLQYLG